MTPRQRCLSAVRGGLANAKDDLHRAEAAFRNYSQTELNEPHRASDMTPAGILEDYRKSVTDWNAALDWLESKQ